MTAKPYDAPAKPLPRDPVAAATATAVAGLVLKLVEKGVLSDDDAREIYGVAGKKKLEPKITTFGSDIEAEITQVVAALSEARGKGEAP